MLCRRMVRSAGSTSVGIARASGTGSSQWLRSRVSSASAVVPTGPSSTGRARRSRAASASRHTLVAMR
jgi:hypothetical protein